VNDPGRAYSTRATDSWAATASATGVPARRAVPAAGATKPRLVTRRFCVLLAKVLPSVLRPLALTNTERSGRNGDSDSGAGSTT